MGWLGKFLTSSLGQKLIMSLTGLFLILFLVIHLLGNLQLLFLDGGKAFNTYAYQMTTNPFIKTVSYGLYFFILLHAFQGIAMWLKNKAAKGSSYAVKTSANGSFASKNMAYLGLLILVFLGIHMGDFWYQMKFGELGMKTYDGVQVKDLYTKVYASFKNPIIVVVYIISMIGLYFHLNHGFSSAFQTLGLNHKKYTPFIKGLGVAYAFIVCIAFAIIPIIFYFAR